MGILRFVLAITVVIAHSSAIFGFTFVGGQIAVQAFYIISGFYMTLILKEKYIGVNSSYRLFISNRFLRLFPIYWTVLFLTIASSLTIAVYTNGNSLENFGIWAKYFNSMSFGSFVFLLFTNLFIVLQDVVMFLGIDLQTGNLFFTSNFSDTSPQLHLFLFIPQAWTIAVEISFYIIAPFLVLRKLKFIVLLILLSFILRVFLYHFGLNHDPWSYRFFPTELIFFLLGVCSYHIYSKIRHLTIKKGFLITIWASMLVLTFVYEFVPTVYKYPIYLFLFFICLPFIFLLTKKWKYDTYIGDLSYPIYISHIFVLACMSTLNIPVVWGLGLTLTVMTVLFSILINELVAKKVEKIRQNRIVANTGAL